LSLSDSKDPDIVYGVFEGIVKALSNPWLYSALAVYAIATCFWLYILQRIPLSQAYPFTAIAMIIVPMFSVIIFGDKLSYSYWMGALLIISGISIIAR
jgi:drug/metabolite transporter (DMT)-like permease